MSVIKEDGSEETFGRSQIYTLINDLSFGLSDQIDINKIASEISSGMYQKMAYSDFIDLISETVAYLAINHPDYAILAARVLIKKLHENTPDNFSDYIEELNRSIGPKQFKLISDEVYDFVMANKKVLNEAINCKLDYNFDFFGYKTLEKSYLLSKDGKIIERPQYLFMRVMVGINLGNIEKILEGYHLISNKYYIHASPTLFNAATLIPQMSSCFVVQIESDSLSGIFNTAKDCALISKYAGGIGLSIHQIRSSGSIIKSTNGKSNGIVPMLRVFNSISRYVDQGGGKRKGGFAVYLEPWHSDIFDFLDLRKNHGSEERRARDLFYGLWIPDLFMNRVKDNSYWSLMCPDVCKGLPEVWGEEFEKLYISYEEKGMYVKQIQARDVWVAILNSQIETGTPFMLYKDAANRKSNQKHLGTIQCSNLCTEIIQYIAPDETAVCNLASIVLPTYVDKVNKTFNFEKLREVVKVAVVNLNNVIDKNYYPTEKAKMSNKAHRPLGLGIQGLADTYALMQLPFDSSEANDLNKKIFECLYFASLESSHELAVIHGPHSSFKGSPLSAGKFQFDLWNEEYIKNNEPPVKLSGMWDWEDLRKKIVKDGVRNSLLLAPMPTASTSQIMGSSEAFEPYLTNLFSRRVLSGEYYVFNKHLVDHLCQIGKWNEEIRRELIAYNGSVQRIECLSPRTKELFKTVWEIKKKTYIDQAVSRAPFICQSQSLTLYMSSPDLSRLTSMHFYAWKKGLKTGMYYLRTTSAAEALKFTVDQKTFRKAREAAKTDVKVTDENEKPGLVCPLNKQNMEFCESCSS